METNRRLKADSAPLKGGAPARILIADDDQKLLALLEKVLENEGYDVVTVTSGNALINSYVRCAEALGPDFDLILADVRMPGCSGVEAVERLRGAGCLAPIILMTALSECDLCQRAPELASSLLAKPFRLAELRASVRASLASNVAVLRSSA